MFIRHAVSSKTLFLPSATAETLFLSQLKSVMLKFLALPLQIVQQYWISVSCFDIKVEVMLMSSSRCSCLLNKNRVYLFYFQLQNHMGTSGWDPWCYTKAWVSCQKSNKTFLHDVVGETSKHWEHRWMPSPIWTEWLCYMPEPCCCSCTNCPKLLVFLSGATLVLCLT